MSVAGKYVHGFICAFRHSKGSTPAPSEYPSSSSSEDDSDRASFMELVEEGNRHRRKARDAALCRDNYRCIISGDLDYVPAHLSVSRTSSQKPLQLAQTLKKTSKSGQSWQCLLTTSTSLFNWRATRSTVSRISPR
ncbi:hypothetical protein F5I97DRAFT_998195 [Phlebopus sp. FC_14]|nr:hypothetical protein F5I97DRAFT_998195 [Phlebopus sp. FC_14]